MHVRADMSQACKSRFSRFYRLIQAVSYSLSNISSLLYLPSLSLSLYVYMCVSFFFFYPFFPFFSFCNTCFPFRNDRVSLHAKALFVSFFFFLTCSLHSPSLRRVVTRRKGFLRTRQPVSRRNGTYRQLRAVPYFARKVDVGEAVRVLRL